jgi:hypothetical protein
MNDGHSASLRARKTHVPILTNDAGDDGGIGHAGAHGHCLTDTPVRFDDEANGDFAAEAGMLAETLLVAAL